MIGAGTFDFFQAHATRRVCLRVQVKQQHSSSHGRHAGREIYGCRRFSHPALLIGNRNNFCWHLGDLTGASGAIQAHALIWRFWNVKCPGFLRCLPYKAWVSPYFPPYFCRDLPCQLIILYKHEQTWT